MKRTQFKHNTIGVRFLGGEGHNLYKVYTYGIRRGVKVVPGALLVADTPRGPAVCAVVRVDKTPMPAQPDWRNGLQFITQRVEAL
jgi:hypothetical protein